MRELKALLTLSKWIWQLFALLIVILAVLVVLGRSAIDSLPDYKAAITEEVSSQLGYEVTINSLVGEWYTLNPSLFLKGVEFYTESDPQNPIISIGEIIIEPNLPASILHRRLVVRQLVINQVNISLEETKEGRWLLGNKGIGDSESNNLDNLNNMFFDSRLLSINRLNVDIRFSSGAESALQLSNVALENSGGYHRIQATAAAGQTTTEMARVIIEGRGNPLDYGEFEGKAYARFSQINNVGLLRASFERWLPEQFDNVGEVQTDINGEIWLALDGKGLGRINGYLEAAEVPLNWFKQTEPITGFDAALTGQYQKGKGWQLTAQQITFNWQGEAIEPFTISYGQPAGTQWGYGQLNISHMNVALLNRIAQQTGILPESVTKVLAQLNPTGQVKNLQARLNESSEKNIAVEVKANLTDIAIDSINKAPAVKNLNGYFEMHGLEGILQINSPNGLSLLYPTAFKDYMNHGAVKGWLNWKIDNKRSLNIISGPIQVNGEEGQGAAYLYLDIPLNRDVGPGIMFLQAGLKNSHSRFRNQFIPQTLPDALSSWLDTSIGDADVTEAGFIWRGSLGKKDHIDRTIQLYIKAENAELKFQPNWPALDDMSFQLTVNDTEASGTVSTAQMLGATVNEAFFDIGKTEESAPLILDIKGKGSASVEQGLTILNESPIRSYLEPLQSWRFSGDTTFALSFAIPIQDIAAATYRVDVDIDNATLNDADDRLNFSNLNTTLSYRTNKGLFAKEITGKLWEKNTVKAQLQSTDHGLLLTGKTTVPVDILSSKFSLPLSPFIEGKTGVDFSFRQSAQTAPPVLQVDTNFKGVSIDLPEPFNKTEEDTVPSKLKFIFGKDNAQYQVSLGDQLQASFSVAEGSIKQGTVLIGSAVASDQTSDDNPKTFPATAQLEPNHFMINGQLATFDLNQWQQVYQQFSKHTNMASLSVSPEINLQIDQFNVATTSLQNVALTGFQEAAIQEAIPQEATPPESIPQESAPETVDTASKTSPQQQGSTEELQSQPLIPKKLLPKRHWVFNFTSESADGRVTLPAESSAPLDLALTRLVIRLPEKPDSEDTESSWLSTINPAELPLMNFSVSELTVANRLLGNVEFKLRPFATGAAFNQINGTLGGLILGGEKDIETRLVWNQKPDQVLTRFEGLIKTKNIGDELVFWGYPRMMESKSAYLLADLQWRGLPDQFKLTHLKGNLVIGSEKGVFYNSQTVATGAAMRTLGLLNFATWIRRLKLDFSDIFSKGVSYDEISGGLQFNEGTMDFSPEIKVKMPSGRMLLSGQANLETEQLNAGLVMTLPVSTNLPWIAALAGGLPAAAGVYLTSKLFESEVDRFSSLSYKLTGSWDEPDVAVDKIFSDKPAKE